MLYPIRKKTKHNVLVTGGGGFLGGAIVRRLRRIGHHVTSFSRKFYPELYALKVHQIRGDIRDRIAVENALRGMDTVYHTAALPGIWGPYEDFFQINVVGTRNIVDGCRASKVPFLVYTSSPSVVFNGSDMEGVNESAPYPSSFSAGYPKTKAEAERLVGEAQGIGPLTMILRPHLIWGPGDNHLVPRILARAKRLRIIGNGNNLVDTTYIDNAADAHLLAAQALEKFPELSGKIYFISNGEPLPIREILNGILAAGGHPPITKALSSRLARFAGSACESLYRALKIPTEPPMTRFVAEELSTAHWFDISAAKTDLGYVPEVTVREGLQRLKKWLGRRHRDHFF